MSDLKNQIDELAELMQEFRLAEAERSGEGWSIAFKRRTAPAAAPVAVIDAPHGDPTEVPFGDSEPAPEPAAPAKAAGLPINSPMTGIYYTAPSPSAPPFVSVGDVVEAGQVVGLIEAMKVFNEIVAPMSGTVTEIAAQSGQLVQPGEALLYIS